MLKKLLLATTALFTLFVAPAQAGPLIGGIGTLIGGITGTGLSIGGLALGIFSMGAQWLISMLLAPEVEQKGVKTKMDTGGDNPPSFILGEYCTAGQLIYANVWDKSGYNIENADLVYVIQLSCKPVNALSNVVFANNERVTLNPGTNWNGFMQVDEYVKGASGGGYFLVKFHDGTQSNADSWLLDKFGSDPDRPWKSDMVGEGCAYVIVQAWYSNRGIWTGLPDLRWVVQGSALYDPRKDSTVGGSGTQRRNSPNTWTFTKNPKVIEYNAIIGIRQSGEHLWGGDAEAYRLPLDYWFAAMNACDENISRAAGGTLKRYEIGCEIHLDDKPIDIIAEINKSCNGYTTEFGGTYKTWVGGPGLPVGTITDDDFLITADMETNKFQSQQSTYNTAYATYPEPNQQWEPKDGPRYQLDTALAEDGEELAIDISLPFVSENNQVQRVMRMAVKDSRRQVTHEGQLPPKAWVYEPFDCLAYQSELFGYSGDGKDFIIASKDDLPNVNQRVLLREVDITDGGWLPEYEQAFDTAPLVIVTPGTMQADFDVFPDQVDTTTGTDKPAIRAEWVWAGPEIDVRKVDWQLRYPGTTKIIATGSIIYPEAGEALIEDNVLRFGMTYEIQFRAVPYAVRDSEWTDWKTVTCVVVAVPTAPSLTRISEMADDGTLIFFVDVDWIGVAQEATYEIRAVSGAETRYYPADSVGARIPVVSGKTYTIAVAAVGSDGTSGNWSSTTNITVTKKNTAPTTPAGLTAVGGIQHSKLAWTKSPDKDYAETIIYRSTTNDFTTATEVGRKTGNRHVDDDLANATTYYYWIVHVDRSANPSAKHPTSNTAGVSATTRRVADADTDPTAPSVPAAPTLAQTNRDVDGDGKVDIAIKVTWAAATGAKSYELEITQGSDVSYVQTKNRSHIFQAKSGMLYSVKVAGVSFNLTASAFSAATTFTPAKKSALPATPGGLAANAKASAVRLDWTGATEADFKWARIYRNTTNTPGTATAIGKTKADWFRDDAALVFGTTYYYWVAFIDTSDNEGSKSSVASVVYTGTTTADLADGAVTEAKTDQTLPGTPAAPTLTTFAADIDGDGTIDTGLTLSVTAPAGVKVIGYEIERYRAATVGGSYTVRGERLSFPAEDPNTAGTVTAYSFKANKSYFWKVRARAIAFNGKKGAWSAQTTTGVSPLGYSAALTASAPSVTQIANGYRVSWTKPTDKAYKETEILVAGSPIARIKGTTYPDTTSRTVGDTPSYTVRHYDNSDNAGTASSATVAPAYRAATSAEIGTNQVTTALLAPDAVDATVLAPAAVFPSNYYRSPAGNLVPDYELLEIDTEWTFKQWQRLTTESTAVALPSGNRSATLNPSDAGWGGSDNTFTFFPSAPGPDLWNIVAESKAMIPIIEKRRYKYGAVVSQPGATSTKFYNGLYVEILFWKTDALGALVLISSEYVSYGYTFSNYADVAVLVDDCVSPAGATFASIRVRGLPVGGQAAQPSIKMGSPFIQELPKGSDVCINLVGHNPSATSFGAAAGGVQVALISLEKFGRLAKADLPYAESALISVAFRHTSGAIKDIRMEVNLVNVSNVLQENYYNSGIISMRDNELISFTVSPSDSGGVPVANDRFIELRCYGSAAGNTIGVVNFNALLTFSID